MKKVLLVAVIALVTLSASAVNRPHIKKGITKEMRATLSNGEKAKITSITDAASVEAKLKARISDQNEFGKITRRAGEEEVDLVPAIAEYGWYFSEILGGTLQRNMYEGASFLVEGEKAYLAPFEGLGYVEGVLNPTAENPLADYGAVVYEFTCAPIAESTSGLILSLETADFDVTTRALSRNGQNTFYAYYIEEYKELYCPEFLALFDATNTADTEIFSERYVLVDLDIIPKSVCLPYISTGTFTGKSLWDGSVMTGDCEIYLGYSAYYVKGANGCVGFLPDAAGDNAWIEFAYDELDESIVTVADYQYTGGPYTFASGDTGYIVTVGAVHNGTEVTGFADDDASVYKVTDNADGTTTIANTNNTAYGDYVISNLGFFETLDLSITITYELAYPDAGGEDSINGVKAEKTNNTNGTYNLNGQRVSDNAKGLIIRDGKKYIVK